MYKSNKPNLKFQRRVLRRNQTRPEYILWRYLRNRQLKGFKFYRQFSIENYILDFYCHELKLAIELDGEQHGDRESRIYDKNRNTILQLQGIKVLRFWNFQVIKNIEAVIYQITEWIENSR